MSIIQFQDGTKVRFNGTPTPEDVEEVAASLKLSPIQPEDIQEETPPNTYGARFPAAPDDTPIEAGLKATGNLPTSAFNFGKTVVDAVTHPVDTLRGAAEVVAGGVSKLGRKLGTGVNAGQPETKEEQTFDALVAAFKERYGSVENAQRTATNDPFGFGADVVGILGGGAVAIGKTKQAADAASKVASVVTKPTTAVAAKAADVGKGTARFSAAQAMGLSDDTLTQIMTRPEQFTKEAQAAVNRRTIAEDVQAALAARSESLSETGAHYGPVRDAATPIKVDADFLDTAFSRNAGVEIADGKIVPNTTSKLRSPSDIRGAQTLYDFWAPSFRAGTLTSPEFLNFRSDLATLAKFDREVSKSKPLETVSAGIRHDLNERYRGQIPDLESLDADFSAQQSDFDRLSKGIIDRDGNLTDSAINRIANATGRGKDILIDRLEEASPGITERIKVLKAVEDIESLKNQIAGKYGRAGLFIGAAYTFNPWLAVGTILALPELGVPILRGIGMSTEKIKSTLKLLGNGANVLDEAPAAAIPALVSEQVPTRSTDI